MRRPAAALAALLAPTLIGAVSAGMASAAAAQSAPPPLTLENAKPLAIPARPRLTTHKAPPPAPPPLAEPQLMAFPDVPSLTTPAPVAPPPGPAGAPPVAKPTAKAPTSTPTAPAAPIQAPAPVQATPSVEERVAAASQPAPTLVAPPSPPPPTPTALPPPPPPPVYARAGMLSFPAGSALLPEDSEKLLAKVAEEMRAAPTRRLQLRAYASGEVDSDRQARQLSLTRALAVRERLTALGVRSTRIDVRPLGLTAPPTDADRRDRVDLEYTSE